jgi:hypothetical protein
MRSNLERVLVVALLATACDGTQLVNSAVVPEAGASGAADGSAPGGELSISVCDPDQGPFTTEIDNPYLPFVVGSHHVLDGLEGGTQPAHFEVSVPGDTREVGGVTTLVVIKYEEDPVDGEQAFYAQAPDGTVCIFGEDGDADGALDWEAGQDGNLAGIMMPGSPEVGLVFEMAHGPDGIDRGEITFLGVPTETPAGTFDDTLTVLEDGPSLKKYARGIGEIYDDGIELISY